MYATLASPIAPVPSYSAQYTPSTAEKRPLNSCRDTELKLRDLLDTSRSNFKKQCRKMKKSINIMTTDIVTPVFTRSLMLKYWLRCEKIIDSCFMEDEQNIAAAANSIGDGNGTGTGTKRLDDGTPVRRRGAILSRHLIAVLCVLAETRSTVLEICTYFHQTKKVKGEAVIKACRPFLGDNCTAMEKMMNDMLFDYGTQRPCLNKKDTFRANFRRGGQDGTTGPAQKSSRAKLDFDTFVPPAPAVNANAPLAPPLRDSNAPAAPPLPARNWGTLGAPRQRVPFAARNDVQSPAGAPVANLASVLQGGLSAALLRRNSTRNPLVPPAVADNKAKEARPTHVRQPSNSAPTTPRRKVPGKLLSEAYSIFSPSRPRADSKEDEDDTVSTSTKGIASPSQATATDDDEDLPPTPRGRAYTADEKSIAAAAAMSPSLVPCPPLPPRPVATKVGNDIVVCGVGTGPEPVEEEDKEPNFDAHALQALAGAATMLLDERMAVFPEEQKRALFLIYPELRNMRKTVATFASQGYNEFIVLLYVGEATGKACMQILSDYPQLKKHFFNLLMQVYYCARGNVFAAFGMAFDVDIVQTHEPTTAELDALLVKA